ncbi:hypothetical protein [Paenibacillus sp. Soil724D2]|uniref:hypothetical protein n=1 Tax=Paenibacillus sp. (strain Soil724D2) TaxID=1736392 RepID=UPI000712493B|nr:hypothetical protein [Paenibacillus sp. Soil724D2]KRE33412.1 hypothetical protein ASG85_14175 [Paenibacillus sp. Soil724D2]
MANRKGLGVSKKYANGTIHETATGKFMVIDRFADEDDDSNTAMLEFQWISGEKEGKTEINRESNMAANIHKFQTSRGRPTILAEPQRIEHNVPFMEKIDMMYDILSGFTNYIDQAAAKVMNNTSSFGGNVERLIELANSNKEYIDKGMTAIDRLDTMVRQQQASILQLTEQIHSLINHSNVFAHQQDAMYKLQATMAMQQETVNKLIEKIK